MMHGFLAQISAPPAAGTPVPEIRDIAPPVDVFPYPTWMIVTAVLAALALLAIGVWALVRWRKSRPVEPPPSPRAIALRELEKLRGEVRKLEPYAFSIAVSDVLREFIGAQYGLRAKQQTSPEFLAEITRSVRFGKNDRQLLTVFLEKCDLIKFAHIDATAEDSEELLTSAIAFVQGDRE